MFYNNSSFLPPQHQHKEKGGGGGRREAAGGGVVQCGLVGFASLNFVIIIYMYVIMLVPFAVVACCRTVGSFLTFDMMVPE